MIPDTYRKIGKCDVLLYCHDVDRGDNRDGLPYSKLIDSVFEDLSDKGWVCRQLAYPSSILTGQRAWGKPASANQRYLQILVRRKIKNLFSSIFKVSISKAETLQEMDNFYRELLELTQPKCVIAIGAPDSMCRAARSLDVPVIELLHGIGYATVPWGWDQQPTCNLPSGILSLDDVSTQTFQVLSTQDIETRQIPHPFFRRFLDEESRKKLPPEWQQKPNWLPEDRTIILVSLQWGYDGDHGSYSDLAGILDNGLIPDQVIDAVEQTHDTVFWLFRLHPVQLRSNKYNHHRRFLDKLIQNHPNCEWRESSMLPLPLILGYCAGHVTMSSMTTYEAAFMAVKSLLLCPTLKPGGSNSCWFSDLRELSLVELGDFDTGMIVKWVTTVSHSSHPFGISTNTDTDWNSAVEWMLGKVYKTEFQVAQ